MSKVIHTEKAPAALGPYSQAIEANGMLFVSGQIPFVPETMTLVSDDVYLGDVKPARACVEVARLPKDVKVEIEVIAVK